MAYSISENCIGCGLCAKSCPVAAITGAVKERHVINPLRCVSCGVCGNVCPGGAVADDRGVPAKKAPKSQWPKPSFNTALCSACSICVKTCGRGALSVSLPAFRGDIHVFAELSAPEKCVGCGLCQRACPLHVITMKGGEAQ